MSSLEDIATLISTSTTIVCDAIFFILQLSYLVGQTLVDVSLLFTNYFLRIWETLSLTLQILYEDSLVFFQDVGEKCNTFQCWYIRNHQHWKWCVKFWKFFTTPSEYYSLSFVKCDLIHA